MPKTICSLLALTIWAFGGLSPVAVAADTSATTAGSDQAAATASSDQAPIQGQLQEVVVTATRTAQPLVQVPISVTALTSADIAQENIQSFTDYAKLVPNLSFDYSGIDAATGMGITIRGIRGNNTTAYYIDDIPAPTSIDPRILDIQRIEVLRGPQGTLFGESSMGGAIRMITNQPDSHEFSGTYGLQSGYTTGAASPNFGGNGLVNIPLIPDRLAVRVAGFFEHDAGWLTNTFLNHPYNPANLAFGLEPLVTPPVGGTTTEGDQARKNSYGGSVSLRWDVTNDFRATARILSQYSLQEGYPDQFGLLGNATTSFPSHPELVTMPAYWFDYQQFLQVKWYMPSLQLTYTQPAFSLTSTTSDFSRHDITAESDASANFQALQEVLPAAQFASIPVQNAVFTKDSKFTQLTEEERANLNPINVGILQFSGLIGYYWSREWLGPKGAGIGGYAQDQTGVLPDGTFGLAASGAWPTNNAFTPVPSDNYDTDSSWYGALNFKFFNRVTLSVGDRRYRLIDYNAGIQPDTGFWFGTNTVSPAAPNETVYEGNSPRYSLTYEINPGASVYASAARGFRQGAARAANQSLPAICDPDLAALGIAPSQVGNVAPDSIWDYEIGTKVQTQKVAFSGDIYNMVWSRMQQSFVLTCSYGVTANAGQAKSSGGELEFTADPVRALSVHGDAGIENAHITEAGPGEFDGEPLFLVPRWSASGGFVYTSLKTFNLPFTSANGPLFFSMDYSYTDSRLSDNTSSRFIVTIPQYHLLSARVGMKFGHSTLSLNGTNLTNGRDNLGDYVSPGFALATPTVLGRHTPVPTFLVGTPRELMLQYQTSF